MRSLIISLVTILVLSGCQKHEVDLSLWNNETIRFIKSRCDYDSILSKTKIYEEGPPGKFDSTTFRSFIEHVEYYLQFREYFLKNKKVAEIINSASSLRTIENYNSFHSKLIFTTDNTHYYIFRKKINAVEEYKGIDYSKWFDTEEGCKENIGLILSSMNILTEFNFNDVKEIRIVEVILSDPIIEP